MNAPGAAHLFLSAGLALAISGAAWRVRALDLSGAIAASVVGFLILGFGGAAGGLALLLFFVSSSALSRWGRKRKLSLDYEKGGERDAAQVLANGGVAAAAALVLLFSDSFWPAAALLGALAAANADTWATEIGSLAAHPPRLITTLRPAPTGSSGAISVPGTLASLAGALLIAMTALLYSFGVTEIVAVVIGGVAGSLFDSLLGATLQVQYRCVHCQKITERRFHHESPTQRERGLIWMNNDAVNVLATLCGALVTALLFLLFGQ